MNALAAAHGRLGLPANMYSRCIAVTSAVQCLIFSEPVDATGPLAKPDQVWFLGQARRLILRLHVLSVSLSVYLFISEQRLWLLQ